MADIDKSEAATGKSLTKEAERDVTTPQHVVSHGHAPLASKSSEHGPRPPAGAYAHGQTNSRARYQNLLSWSKAQQAPVDDPRRKLQEEGLKSAKVRYGPFNE